MKQVRAIIADDEQALRDHLKQKLSLVWPELAVTGEAQNGEEALALIRETGPDIAFLDIQMPGMTGIDVVRQAAGLCLFVFVTAYDTYAIEAFEQNAIDYLLNPVSDERLKKTVKRLKERLADAVPAPDMMTAVLGCITEIWM